MPFPTPQESSRVDGNQQFSLIVVQGTAGTATPSTTSTMPLTGNPSTGALYTEVLSGSIPDGGDVTFGTKADTAITDSTTTNTHMSFLKGLVKILADVWDSTNHWLKVLVSFTAWTPYSNTALSNTKQVIKASAGTLGGYMIFNPNAATIYIQVFDALTANVTVGVTTPTYTLAIPAAQAANIEFANGINHATGIIIAATTTATGSTAPTTALNTLFLYK